MDPSSLGAPLGAASLDAAGKLLVSQLPASITGALYYAGVWDAATNTPPLSTGIGVNGTYYKVSVAGTTSLDGINSWAVGDEAIFSGTAWTKIQGTDAPVQSVNGQTGAVIITRASLSAAASGANSDITSLSSLTTALSVSQGGTGRTTLSGMLKGNGTSGIVSAVAGVDFAPATSGTVAQLLANNGTGGFANVTIGTGLSLLGGELTATAGTAGSVTSVDVSGGTTGISFTGGPVTHNGTITMTGTLGSSNPHCGPIIRNGVNLFSTARGFLISRNNGVFSEIWNGTASPVVAPLANTSGQVFTPLTGTYTLRLRAGYSTGSFYENRMYIQISAGTSIYDPVVFSASAPITRPYTGSHRLMIGAISDGFVGANPGNGCTEPSGPGSAYGGYVPFTNYSQGYY